MYDVTFRDAIAEGKSRRACAEQILTAILVGHNDKIKSLIVYRKGGSQKIIWLLLDMFSRRFNSL